jgi:hypothetical protein
VPHFFNKLISLFVFTIWQIPSSVWRFVVGVLHSPGYGPGLHSISVLGFLHHDELVYSDISEKLAEVSTRTKCIHPDDEAASPSAMSENLPVHGMRTECSSLESQGYMRVSRQSEQISFSSKTLHIGDNVVTDWQTVISV